MIDHPFPIECPAYQVKNWLNGKQYKFKFPNYGASVVRHDGSYGHEDGLYELAVMDKDLKSLVYTTEITDDVIGYLTEKQVAELLERIARL